MNLPADQERLLTDVLGDENSAALRERLLGETLGLARRRRRFLQARRTASVVAVVAALAVGVWRSLPPSAIAPEPARRGYVEVRSQPLRLTSLVITRPLDAARVVASVPPSAIVQTASGSSLVREINDAELLALTGPNPAALVRRGIHQAELVFADPAAEQQMLRN
jgi:hypothetical protein